jgi:hypothetical protein
MKIIRPNHKNMHRCSISARKNMKIYRRFHILNKDLLKVILL